MAGREAAVAAALDELVAAASAVSEEPSPGGSGHVGGMNRTGAQTPESQVTGCKAGPAGMGSGPLRTGR
jgi:hypothetical protein